MPIPFTVSAYWGPRKSSLADSAQMISSLVKAFEGYELLTPLYKVFKNNKQTLSTGLIVPDNISDIENFLTTKVHKNELRPPSIIEELGYSFNLWNGKKNRDVFVSCNIGGYHPSLTNRVVIEFYDNYDFITYDRMYDILKSLIEIFDPDNAVVSQYGIFSRLPEPKNKIPYSSGWIVYRKNLKLTNMNKSFPCEETNNGVILITTKDIFDVDNTQHFNKFVEISDFMYSL